MVFVFNRIGRAFLPQLSSLGDAQQAIFHKGDNVQVNLELRDLFQAGQYDPASESGDASSIVTAALVDVSTPTAPVVLSSAVMTQDGSNAEQWAAVLDLDSPAMDIFLTSQQSRSCFVEFQVEETGGQIRTYQAPALANADGFTGERRYKQFLWRDVDLTAAAGTKFYQTIPKAATDRWYLMFQEALITTDPLPGASGTAEIGVGVTDDQVSHDESNDFLHPEDERYSGTVCWPGGIPTGKLESQVYIEILGTATAGTLVADVRISGYIGA
jgi:hypothetical protein